MANTKSIGTKIFNFVVMTISIFGFLGISGFIVNAIIEKPQSTVFGIIVIFLAFLLLVLTPYFLIVCDENDF